MAAVGPYPPAPNAAPVEDIYLRHKHNQCLSVLRFYIIRHIPKKLDTREYNQFLQLLLRAIMNRMSDSEFKAFEDKVAELRRRQELVLADWQIERMRRTLETLVTPGTLQVMEGPNHSEAPGILQEFSELLTDLCRDTPPPATSPLPRKHTAPPVAASEPAPSSGEYFNSSWLTDPPNPPSTIPLGQAQTMFVEHLILFFNRHFPGVELEPFLCAIRDHINLNEFPDLERLLNTNMDRRLTNWQIRRARKSFLTLTSVETLKALGVLNNPDVPRILQEFNALVKDLCPETTSHPTPPPLPPRSTAPEPSSKGGLRSGKSHNFSQAAQPASAPKAAPIEDSYLVATRNQFLRVLLSFITPHFPQAEPLLRAIMNCMNEFQDLRRLNDTQKSAFADWQIERARQALQTLHSARTLEALEDPNHFEVPGILQEFNALVRDLCQEIAPPPYAAPPLPRKPTAPPPVAAPEPASKGGLGRIGRLTSSTIRKLAPPKRSTSVDSDASSVLDALGPAQPADHAIVGSPNMLRHSLLRRFIVEDFPCPICCTIIPAHRTWGADPQLGVNLHMRCPNPRCLGVFCRGCRDVADCQPGCDVRHACALKECCSDVRAMAIFEHLSAFDEDYLARVHDFSQGDIEATTRLAFLEQAFDPANRKYPQSRGFISILKRTLKYVCYWIMPNHPDNVVCTSVGQMLSTSFLLEVVRVFIDRGIDTLKEFQTKGLLIHRIVHLLFTLKHDAILSPLAQTRAPVIMIEHSPGLRELFWNPRAVWEGYQVFDEDVSLLEHMGFVWIEFEQYLGQHVLQHATGEIDAHLYERGRNLANSVVKFISID